MFLESAHAAEICPPTCRNNIQDEGETSADCGGTHRCLGGCSTSVTGGEGCPSLPQPGGGSGCQLTSCYAQLRCLIDWCCDSGNKIWKNDPDCQIESWDTGEVTTMANLFSKQRPFACWERFNEDLSTWTTTKVRDMSG
eukprot:3931773-Rhodomonas_salina.1